MQALLSYLFWGLISQVCVIKIGVPSVGLEPFAPLDFECLLGCGSPCQEWGFMARLCLSLLTCFDVVFLFA